MQVDRGARMSVEEAAKEIGISVHTLRAWVRQKRIAYLKLGRKVKFDSRDVQKFLDASRVEAVSFER